MWWIPLALADDVSVEAPAVTEADYQRKCDQGETWFCRELAVRYLEGDLVTVSEARPKAEQLLDAACKKGDGDSCARLGDAYYSGAVLEQRKTKSIQLYVSACEAESWAGCGHAAMMYYEGDGIQQSREKVYALAARGCDGRDPRSCHALGLALSEGLGVEADLAKAVDAFQQACARGYDKESCKLKSKLQKQLEK